MTGKTGGGSQTGRSMSAPGRSLLLTLRFLIELAMLAGLAVAGATAGLAPAWRIVLAVTGPLLVIVIWGLVMAPRARRRLADPGRLVAEIVLFLVTAAALALVGQVLWAVAFALVAIGAAVLTRMLTPES